jgi:hypothetical protein
MYYILINLIPFLFVICSSVPVRGQDNLSIIDSLTKTIIEEDVINYKNELPETLAIKINFSNIETVEYLRVTIGNAVTANFLQVYRNYNTLSSFQNLVLEIIRFDVDINYSKPYGKTLFGDSFSKREIYLDLFGQLYDAKSGEIKRKIESKKKYIDEINYNLIDTSEQSPYHFTKGKRLGYTNWEKFLEPTIVLTTVALVIYLFFSQRT